jgi:hypothetical protein
VSPSWIDFLLYPQGGAPCLGVALGRRALWFVQTRSGDKAAKVESCGRIPVEGWLFSGTPTDETVSKLALTLAPVLKNLKNTYFCVQVALPDPLVKFEVFELEKLPPRGSPTSEFLNWRFKADPKGPAASLAVASQVLGEQDGKFLLLGMAVEKAWLDALKRVFHGAGIPVSVTDMALCHRINFFQSAFREKGTGGALVTFEPEYWSLAVLDKEARPRFMRSKWWEGDPKKLKDIPLKETIVEIERTIRSYVYAAKDRSVETLFVAAPDEWLSPLLEALNENSAGGCVGLPLKNRIQADPGLSMESVPPSAVAAAVQR